MSEHTEDEMQQYVDDLIEKGAYRVDGLDPATGERLLVIVPEVMKEVDPELFEYLQLDAELEVLDSLANLEAMGLVRRVDDEHFELTEEGQRAVEAELINNDL